MTTWIASWQTWQIHQDLQLVRQKLLMRTPRRAEEILNLQVEPQTVTLNPQVKRHKMMVTQPSERT